MRDGQGQDADTTSTEDGPWWAGLGAVGGVLLVVAGAGLLVWSSLTGNGDDDHWVLSYGAAKVLAIGCVVGGAALVERRRRRLSDRGAGSGEDGESATDR